MMTAGGKWEKSERERERERGVKRDGPAQGHDSPRTVERVGFGCGLGLGSLVGWLSWHLITHTDSRGKPQSSSESWCNLGYGRRALTPFDTKKSMELEQASQPCTTKNGLMHLLPSSPSSLQMCGRTLRTRRSHRVRRATSPLRHCCTVAVLAGSPTSAHSSSERERLLCVSTDLAKLTLLPVATSDPRCRCRNSFSCVSPAGSDKDILAVV